MKARVKATGEIIEVQHDYDLRESKVVEFYTNIENPKKVFEKEDLEFLNDSEFIDYWTRLEHQAAIAAMQGLMSNIKQITPTMGHSYRDEIIGISLEVARTLVEKYKKEERK